MADAMESGSEKGVLMLALCGQDQAIGSHFAAQSEQVRPQVLECSHEHSLYQAHRAPTVKSGGQHYPALAALTATSEQVNTLESGTLVTSLIDLAGLYDYLLLVTTQAPPYAVVQAIAEQCTRAMIIVPTSEIALFIVPAKRVNTNDLASSLFVAHISEPPTIGVQDRYMAQLGRAVTHLLPADIL